MQGGGHEHPVRCHLAVPAAAGDAAVGAAGSPRQGGAGAGGHLDRVRRQGDHRLRGSSLLHRALLDLRQGGVVRQGQIGGQSLKVAVQRGGESRIHRLGHLGGGGGIQCARQAHELGAADDLVQQGHQGHRLLPGRLRHGNLLHRRVRESGHDCADGVVHPAHGGGSVHLQPARQRFQAHGELRRAEGGEQPRIHRVAGGGLGHQRAAELSQHSVTASGGRRRQGLHRAPHRLSQRLVRQNHGLDVGGGDGHAHGIRHLRRVQGQRQGLVNAVPGGAQVPGGDAALHALSRPHGQGGEGRNVDREGAGGGGGAQQREIQRPPGHQVGSPGGLDEHRQRHVARQAELVARQVVADGLLQQCPVGIRHANVGTGDRAVTDAAGQPYGVTVWRRVPRAARPGAAGTGCEQEGEEDGEGRAAGAPCGHGWTVSR